MNETDDRDRDRWCPNCKAWLDPRFFALDPEQPGGLRPLCVDCED